MSKKWQIASEFTAEASQFEVEKFIADLLKSRGLTKKKEIDFFLHPPDPVDLTPQEVAIDTKLLKQAISRIHQAVKNHESIVVYADYDADGICAGAIMWETLWGMGARVMPYIPHRVDEGYGLSEKGIEAVRKLYDPTLIITVDHGITAHEKVAYAKKLGIEVIVTDHHVKPKKLPDCIIVHTTELAGSGVSWFLAKELLSSAKLDTRNSTLELATIGTIADLLPLMGANRSVVKHGLGALRTSKRKGILALLAQAGVEQKDIGPYTISHILAPRLNAMGRLEHALDALRLLCTKDAEKAEVLSEKLTLTNKERQKLTEDMTLDALSKLPKDPKLPKKLIFISDPSYNQGVIGLVAGRLVEAYYRPAIVLAIGGELTKASARSVSGFNIVEAIRTAGDLLVDVGGHPMAAGFTVETKNLDKLREALEAYAEKMLDEELLTRKLVIDAQIPLSVTSEKLWKGIQELAPFGIGNPEPVFASRGVKVIDPRIIGATKKHLKFRVSSQNSPSSLTSPNSPTFDCVAFNMAEFYVQLKSGASIDIAYTIDMNEWNGNRKLQLKVRDIQISNKSH